VYPDLQQMRNVNEKVQCGTDCVTVWVLCRQFAAEFVSGVDYLDAFDLSNYRMVGSFLLACRPSYWPSMATNVMMYFSPMS